nr:WG repeat-containing protein [uncultured Sediminibacterium sp.]
MKKLLCLFLLMGYLSAHAQKYDKIAEVREGLRMVTKNSKVGFINEKDELVIPLMYDAANGFYEGLSAAKKGGKVGYINKQNRTVIPFEYDGGYNFSKGYAVVGANKKSWMIDKSGNQATLRKYDLLKFGDFGYGMMVLDKKWGYVNAVGQEIIPPEYDYIQNYSEGYIGAKKGNKYGYIDTLDQVKLPFEFDAVSLFKNGIAVVEKNGKAGVIDKSGKTVIGFNYQSLDDDPYTGWYIAEKKDKFGMIDQRGREVIPFEFDDIDYFSDVNEGYANVEYKDKIGMIDMKGRLVIPTRYDKIFECENGYCGVELNKKYGMVSLQNGKEIIPPKYDGIGNFKEGIARYKENFPGIYVGTSKFGYLSVTGKELTSAKYEMAEDFSNGMAAVKLNNKWGYINTEGTEVIFPRYESATDFENEKATVKEDGKYFYIDKRGRLSAIPEQERKKLESDHFEEDMNALIEMLSAAEANAPKSYTLTSSKTPQKSQLVLTSKKFPEELIDKYWKQDYYIQDISVVGDKDDLTYHLIMGKTDNTDQKWATRNTDELIITNVREKYKESNKNYITYLNFLNNQWVVVYTQTVPYTAQSVSASGKTEFPESWVNDKWKEGYAITNVGYGNGRWLVVVSKGSSYTSQKISILDKLDEDRLEKERDLGYVLSDLVFDGKKYYCIFSKVNNISTYSQEKESILSTSSHTEFLQNHNKEGRTIIRNLVVPPNN